ncbi:type VI secretion system ImpA family N-terminal domain-containing protein [Acerihabitans sp. TG2]|uniref:type VI secretion system protein TssA n=1 Tax=Acerihabitans sp. TG2 TaxID=3096008 RepID=UPI002B23EB74|nr:type VI secretion system ImpA family N-terminal domain-containing protein [Acerihabitans sp. TG2]MEA9390977.1 type VI secretion system ImpA family N-terminal domain-containing protein [Acerihabitans sp. TG2]
MNSEQLLIPVSAELPCGENLEYEPAYMHLCQLARGKPEQQFGDTIIPAAEPDWREVEKAASALLARSKDLRLMLLLAQSWTALHGLSGYADGVSLISEALARFWPSLLPLLSQDGEDDPFMRVNTLRELGDGFTLAKLLRTSRFSPAAGGLTFAEAATFLGGGEMPARDYPGGATRLSADVQAGIDAQSPLLARSLEAIERIQRLLRQHLGASAQPEMPYLFNAMTLLCQRLVPSSGQATAQQDLSDGAPAAAQTDRQLPSRDQEITSRDEAYRALESVKAYFTRYESSHPAPLMISRIQLLMSQDFMAIVRNLAPDAVGTLEHFFGCEKDKQ